MHSLFHNLEYYDQYIHAYMCCYPICSWIEKRVITKFIKLSPLRLLKKKYKILHLSYLGKDCSLLINQRLLFDENSIRATCCISAVLHSHDNTHERCFCICSGGVKNALKYFTFKLTILHN